MSDCPHGYPARSTCVFCQRDDLRAALQDMFDLHGDPHREEWMNDTAFELAKRVYEQARRALDGGEGMISDLDVEMVEVPRWALKFVMANADLCDRGPPGEGWCSDEMRKAQDALREALSHEHDSGARMSDLLYTDGYMSGKSEATDEIEALKAEIEQLRAALIELDTLMDFGAPAESCPCFQDPSRLNAAMVSARRALDGEKG